LVSGCDNSPEIERTETETRYEITIDSNDTDSLTFESITFKEWQEKAGTADDIDPYIHFEIKCECGGDVFQWVESCVDWDAYDGKVEFVCSQCGARYTIAKEAEWQETASAIAMVVDYSNSLYQSDDPCKPGYFIPLVQLTQKVLELEARLNTIAKEAE